MNLTAGLSPISRTGALLRRCFTAAFALIFASAHAANTVRDTRFAKLKKGVNLGHWFSQTRSYNATHYNTFITQTDINGIKAKNFTHVRLPIEPTILLDESNPTVLKPDITYVENTVKMITGSGLAAVVDLHPDPQGTFDDRIVTDSNWRNNVFIPFWETLARRIAGLKINNATIDADLIFFEIINEPTAANDSDWAAVLPSIVAGIRRGAPGHTVVVGSNRYNSFSSLIGMTPLSDQNVVYTFHYYNPFTFTHQGASWVKPPQSILGYVPYPSNSSNVQQASISTSDSTLRTQAENELRNYGNAQWKRSKIEGEIQQVANWRNQHGVRVYLGEFGVLKEKSPYVDRYVWHADVMESAEKFGIGWCKWNYQSSKTSFGVTYDENGARQWDWESLNSLFYGIISGATYKVQARHSGKALDAAGVGTSDGTNVQQWQYGGGNNQLWRVSWQASANGFNWYRLSPLHALDKCLDVNGGASATGNGANVHLWTYYGNLNQQWSITSATDGSKRLTPRHASAQSLDVSGGPSATADGQNVQQWQYGGGTNQQWWVNRWAP
jgi:aryl-phospho-beta-D-glucosidase BglC (GH1 family)